MASLSAAAAPSSSSQPTAVNESQAALPADDAKSKDTDKVQTHDNVNSLLHFAHLRVLAEFKYHKCMLREFDTMNCDGAPLLLGFPGEGITSPLCANYLVDKLNLPLIGDILSFSFPLSCVVSRCVPSAPVRLYGDSRVVVVLSDVKVNDQDNQQLTKSICEALLDFAKRHRSSFVLAVEGIRQEEEDKVQLAIPVDDESGSFNPDDLADSLISSLAEKRIKSQSKKQKDKKDSDKDTKKDDKKETDKTSNKHSDKDKDKQNKKDKESGKKSNKDANGATKDEKRKALDEEEVKRLLFLCNKRELAMQLTAMGHEPLESGVFQGITASLLLQAPFVGTTIALLCAEFKKIDAKAAEPIVCEVAKLLHVSIDMHDLHERMVELQAELNKVLESIVDKDEPPSGGAAAMYM